MLHTFLRLQLGKKDPRRSKTSRLRPTAKVCHLETRLSYISFVPVCHATRRFAWLLRPCTPNLYTTFNFFRLSCGGKQVTHNFCCMTSIISIASNGMCIHYWQYDHDSCGGFCPPPSRRLRIIRQEIIFFSFQSSNTNNIPLRSNVGRWRQVARCQYSYERS